jgi:N utilization substance protein B
MSKINLAARHKARHFALQALYQWQLTRDTIANIKQQFATDSYFKKVDLDYFSELLTEIPKQISNLDQQLTPFLDRVLNQLDPIELVILHIAAYELYHRLDVPYRVVINEAVKLAKVFGGDESYKYINGVLDRVAKVAREEEIKLEARR